MNKIQKHWIYARYISIAILYILPFALFQYWYVLKLGAAEIPIRFFIIPVVVGMIFGFLLGKIKILQQDSSRQVVQLTAKDEALQRLNIQLEEKVKHRTRELAVTQSLTQNILDSQINIVMLTDGKQLRNVNLAFFQLFSEYPDLKAFLTEYNCICNFFIACVHDKDACVLEYMGDELWVEYIASRPKQSHKVRILYHGRDYIFDVKVRASRQQGKEKLYVATFTDISEIIAYKNQLEITSKALREELFTDHLTGLPNRTKLLNDLEQVAIKVLILVDIDGFREINNFFGHQNGDEILCGIADYLQPYIQNSNSELYRLSADEFAITALQLDSEAQLLAFCQELHQLLETHTFTTQSDSEILLGVSLGLSLHPPVAKSHLLSAAALALKTAKRTRKPMLVYNPGIEMHQIYARNLEEARLVKTAIQQGKVHAHFQPILNNKTLNVEKYECLARLFDEQNQLVLPGRFINAAKTTKLYHHITRMMLEQILEKIQDTSCYQFSLNLSTDDILDQETVAFILNCIKQYNIGKQLVIELLESEGIENFPEVTAFIHRAKQLGCRIAIDDFGSGYSNFDYILKLDVDYLKIDASLVRDLDQDESSRLIVKTIQNFATQLGIKTIAEHVHSKAVLDSVIEIGINYSQGFYIGKPHSDLGQYAAFVKNG
ncbi:EAL domain-containing protein [Candidatus Venteria ishoeyi]|uniref:EAL domain-containing protein n=1 Tax=Candidatus Venteria ishoeyi TaxID=1899563 RepID=UPI0015AB1CF3|nr:bifunctional diguanylate cyclase/phosphodiesterase [Candidatus Venteria ishoeyi]MDM8545967.1 bifunctional diguanylate cyclase/phosphodiesterase [Candidatus Venteria ishoeyi]